MSDIAVVFSADTGRFVANVDGMSASVAKSAQSVADAKNRILQSFEQQIAGAEKTGASASQLATIQTKAAQSMASVTEANATKIVNSLDRISARQKAVAAELGNLKVPEVKEQSDVSDRMRASALLRGGGLRAGENFASQFDIFNKISTLAFPVLGLATLGVEAVKLGTELFDAFDIGGKRARETAQEVLSVGRAIDDSNTSLDVQIDKLQEREAKLEHKPFNSLKLLLDESADSANKLIAQLDGVVKKEIDVATSMSATKPQQFILGFSDNSVEIRMDQEHQKWLDRAKTSQDAYNESVSQGNQLQQRLNTLQTQQAKIIAIRSGPLGGAALALGLKDHSSEIDALQTQIALNAKEQTTGKKYIEHDAQQARTQTAEDKANADRDAKTAATQAREGFNKAGEERIHAMEAYAATWKTLAPVSSKALYDYWEVQKSAFAEGSNQFNAIAAKQAELAVAGAEKFHAGIEKLKASIKEASQPIPADIGRNLNFPGNNAESVRSLNRAGLSAALGSAEDQATVDKAKISIDLADGSISKLTADQRLASIEAALHSKRLADLNEQLEELKKNSSYNTATGLFASDKDKQTAISLQSQITKESATASVDAMKSAADITGQTWYGSLKEANAKWVQDSQDSAKQIAALYTQVMSGVNNALADLLVDKHPRGQSALRQFRNNLGGTADGVAHSLASNGLNRLESSLFGGGKPDGSTSRPLNVRIIGGIGSVVGSAGGAVSSAASSAASGIGGFFSKLFGGTRAIGGDVTPGSIYRINESGQEMFAPSVSGKIIPAGGSSGSGGGNAYYNVQVANGVTPEAMNMHMQTVLAQYHGTVMRDSIAANRDHARRHPSTAR